MKSVLEARHKEWAYKMWCLGYTENQIAAALDVCEKTIQRAIKGRPRVRPVLVYNELETGQI